MARKTSEVWSDIEYETISGPVAVQLAPGGANVWITSCYRTCEISLSQAGKIAEKIQEWQRKAAEGGE